MDGEGAGNVAVNQIQDENVDNSRGYVEIGRIENDEEVIIVQIENPNISNPIEADPQNRPQEMNPLEQQAMEISADEGILTPNRKKRKRLSTKKSPVKPLLEPLRDDDDDGSTCAICLDSWESGGDHKLVALKCGHLFGDSCIQRWLREQGQAKSCPTCKAKVVMKDIRPLFAKKVMVIDKSEEYRLKGLVDQEKSKSLDLELRINTLTLELDVMKHRCTQLEAKLQYAQVHGAFSEITSTTASSGIQRQYRMSLEKTFELNREGNSRAMVFGRRTQSLFVSQKSATALFPGFIVRTVNITSQNLAMGSNFPLMSTKTIRDLSLDADEEYIIAASTEKSAKIFSVPNKCRVSEFTPSENKTIWAATFDKQRTKTLYLGAQGSTYMYDIRNPQAYVEELTTPGDGTPVVGITSVPGTNQLPFGGFIVCKLHSLWFYEYTASQQILATKLVVEGPFVSVTYDDRTHFILIGTKPSTKYQKTRYILANLTKIDQMVRLNTISTMWGSSGYEFMLRSAQVHIGDDILVSAYLQDTKKLTTWNAMTADKLQSVGVSDVVYDLCPLYATNKTYMAALSETKCRIFQVNSI